jgi:serine/threonine-protein kinase
VSQPPSDTLIGHVIDRRYFVEDKIARGGMATVYRALDYRLERPVAIKVMHPHLAADEAFTRRFIQEARQAARLAHPNIVNVFDQGQDGEYTYIVMEYLPGITLRQLLNDFTTLTWEQTLDVVKAVLNGLDAAHSAGIVHRDVKPENVLLADDGRIKIADFGLARAASHNTQTGQALLGTVAYLSPELVTGSPADIRSDIYGLGIMMFEMLTGEQPFTGDEAIAIAYQHANNTVPPPSEKNPHIPQELDDVVRWCTERDPANRPSHARALLEHVVNTERAIRRRLASEPRTQVMEPATTDLNETRVMVPSALSVDDQPTEVLNPAEAVFGDLDVPEYAQQAPAKKAKTAVAPREGKKGPKPWVLALLGVAVALAAFSGGALLWLSQQPGAPEVVVVEDVAGLDAARASVQLTAQGLVVATELVERFDEDVAEGLVIETDPLAGSEAEMGSEITLVVSQGPAPVGLPAVIGLTVDEATTLLEDAGLVVGEISQEFSRIQPLGQVLQATDEGGIPVGPGSELARETIVNLLVSAGTVPDVTGLPLDQARQQLDEVGLVGLPSGDGAFSDTVAEGSVISMDIPSGQVVRPGDTINLTISRGPELIPVPDVLGRIVAEARIILEEEGFVVVVRPQDQGVDPEEALSIVTLVEPAAGQAIPRGSTVTLRSIVPITIQP